MTRLTKADLARSLHAAGRSAPEIARALKITPEMVRLFVDPPSALSGKVVALLLTERRHRLIAWAATRANMSVEEWLIVHGWNAAVDADQDAFMAGEERSGVIE